MIDDHRPPGVEGSPAQECGCQLVERVRSRRIPRTCSAGASLPDGAASLHVDFLVTPLILEAVGARGCVVSSMRAFPGGPILRWVRLLVYPCRERVTTGC